MKSCFKITLVVCTILIFVSCTPIPEVFPEVESVEPSPTPGEVSPFANIIRPHTVNTITGFGMGSSTFIRRANDVAAAYAELHNLGVTYIREEFPMEACQFEMDRCNFGLAAWEDFDRAVDLASQNGLEIVALLTYGPSYHYDSDDDFFEFWEIYVSTLVDRYGEDIHYWEIGNEMNSLEFWHFVREDAAQVEVNIYARMLSSAYSIIKTADPEDLVILGGLINDTDFTGGYTPLEFLLELHKISDGVNFDALGLHTYWGPAMPETPRLRKTIGETLPFTMVNYVKDFSAKAEEIFGVASPVWVTEVGYSDQELSELASVYHLSVEELQAAALSRIYPSLLSIPQVEAVFWYAYENDNSNQQYALKESSKKAFQAISSAIEYSSPKGNSQVIDQDDKPIENIYDYRFERSDGNTVSIYWKNLPDQDVVEVKAIDLVETPAYHYDLSNGLSIFTRVAEDGSTTFEVAEMPKILMGNMDANTKFVFGESGDVLGTSIIDYGEMVLIPAGEFQMGCDPEHNGGFACESNALPLHPVYLDDFYIDKYEVTNSQYNECVNAGVCRPSFLTGYPDDITYTNFPVLGISSEEAETYCTWLGKRLPTEAEWEKAARGTTVRSYPWGDEKPNCNLANYRDNASTRCSPEIVDVSSPSAVGSHPEGVSPYGIHDMAGNVSEWVSDLFGANYYLTSPYKNPQGPSIEEATKMYWISGACRENPVLRGGSNWDSPEFITTSSRQIALEGVFSLYGIRCASDYESPQMTTETPEPIIICPGAPPQRLKVGMIAKVCTKSDPLRLRKSPGTDGAIIGSVKTGELFEIIDGPVCAGNNWTWWKVFIGNTCEIGWLAEGGDAVDPYFLCPIN